ncbi:MAG: class I SAM-dependent methyltransferase [Candidatus Lokiarchaeota archaeon]|nr:class I SAM-dependent methyltransferase [Candidatus Lokiarchaeota archaeon]
MIDLTSYKKIFGEFATDADFINEIIGNLNLEKDSKILDVGTGLGTMSILLALNGFHLLTGEPEVDPEREGEEHHGHYHEDNNESHVENNEEHNVAYWIDWRESAKNLGVEDKIRYQNFDVQSLTFNNQSFDGIFLYDTLQHVKNREKALKECIRVLKNNGVIVIIEWSKKQIEEDFKKYGYKIDYIDPRDFLNRKDILIEQLNSEVINVYLLRKK